MSEVVEIRSFSGPVMPIRSRITINSNSQMPLRDTTPSILLSSSSATPSPFFSAIDDIEALNINKSNMLMELNPRPQDAWLPITESRDGNAYYAAFHTLCSGIGIHGLLLPVAFTVLGWTWGIICLTLAFLWQLYTIYLLVHLHESAETGMRYSRYLQLCSATFGQKIAQSMFLFPIIDLSAGTCMLLTIVGGSDMSMFFGTLCETICISRPLTTADWYLVFTCGTVILSQLPNLNSIACVSLMGAISSVSYYTLLWAVPVTEGRLPNISHPPMPENTQTSAVLDVVNAVGIIAFAFRGHNLILEIQATMPSNEKSPSHVPMWKGVKSAYSIIAVCLFPLAIGGYWAYGHMIPKEGGMLVALYMFHGRDTSRFVIELTTLLLLISTACSFPIYAMPVFDGMESLYTSRTNKPCPWWLRGIFRVMFGFLCFFLAVAISFYGTLGSLGGGFSLPLTLAVPCFMWIKIKKPEVYSLMWWLNWGLGLLGMALSGILIVAGVFAVMKTGIEVKFFKPR